MNLRHIFSLSRRLAPALLLAGLFATSLSAQRDRSLESYILMSTITGDASMGRATGAPIDMDFGAILDSLEIGGMVHFEAFQEDGPWGFVGDYALMNLGMAGNTPKGGIIDAEQHQGTLEALVAYRQPAGDVTIDWYIGARWWDFDIDLTIDPGILPGSSQVSISEDWIDLFAGARFIAPINDQWTVMGQLDLGGLTGADFTLRATLGADYQFAEHWFLHFQYVGLWVDYDNGRPNGDPNHFAYDTLTHGPYIGIGYEF